MYELEWRTAKDQDAGSWRAFASADALKVFTATEMTHEFAFDGELRVRSLHPEFFWEVTTTFAEIARWRPPSAPQELLASGWATSVAGDASVGRHTQRLRVLLSRAANDGLLDEQQSEAFVEMFTQAVLGNGIIGKGLEPIADRPDEIRKSRGA